ncbi:hypothetical protein [Paenibacillus xylanexedens]|uniref:hypothetical protein n=1 Tax=Paenibacillus xylanexedens TaxID=528191 RepID=UPI000F537E84|nr:hypothetical protein [Paenibacillus xylanexedens]RPK23977.1 hypothetical protein EDO6_04915 [Paenibacillus xylanexedens]
MANKITLETIDNLKEIKQTKDIQITDVHGNTYDVQLDTFFYESKVEKIASDYLELLIELNKMTDVDNEKVRQTFKLIYVMVLREFTDIPIPTKANINDLIGLSVSLGDSGITNEVMKSIPNKEFRKIEKKLKEVEKQTSKIMAEVVAKTTI